MEKITLKEQIEYITLESEYYNTLCLQSKELIDNGQKGLDEVVEAFEYKRDLYNAIKNSLLSITNP